jgi:hypothetical protein
MFWNTSLRLRDLRTSSAGSPLRASLLPVFDLVGGRHVPPVGRSVNFQRTI